MQTGMSRSMRLLLLQRSFSDHIRSSTSKAIDMLSKTAREGRLTGEWQGQWLAQRVFVYMWQRCVCACCCCCCCWSVFCLWLSACAVKNCTVIVWERSQTTPRGFCKNVCDASDQYAAFHSCVWMLQLRGTGYLRMPGGAVQMFLRPFSGGAFH